MRLLASIFQRQRACASPGTTAWTYVGDSVWEPLAPPDTDVTGLNTAANALVELLSALARRQHQHCSHTVARLSSWTTPTRSA